MGYYSPQVLRLVMTRREAELFKDCSGCVDACNLLRFSTCILYRAQMKYPRVSIPSVTQTSEKEPSMDCQNLEVLDRTQPCFKGQYLVCNRDNESCPLQEQERGRRCGASSVHAQILGTGSHDSFELRVRREHMLVQATQ